VHEAKKDQKKGVSLLVSNGFATLFLVFHPYYSSGFQFTDLGEDAIGGHIFHKVQFKHIPGMRSPAALALRGGSIRWSWLGWRGLIQQPA